MKLVVISQYGQDVDHVLAILLDATRISNTRSVDKTHKGVVDVKWVHSRLLCSRLTLSRTFILVVTKAHLLLHELTTISLIDVLCVK